MKNPPKLFLIRASGFSHSIPYGLLYIKSFLRKANFDVSVYDREGNESMGALKSALQDHRPDIIGISAMTAQSFDADKVIKTIREWFPDKTIIAGGVHYTATPETGFEAGADYVIQGEGELAMHDFLTDAPLVGKKIIRGKAISDLDDIPMLFMSDIKPFVKIPDKYKGKGFHIITARGCPYYCNFCLGKDQRPKGIRYHSIDSIVEYISMIAKEFGIDTFNIVDDVFVIKLRRVIDFCEKTRSRISSPLRFHCFTHAGHGTTELYRTMRNAGFFRVSMGVEHGNDNILALMGKKTTKAKIEKTCSQIHEAGLELNLTYILGNIEETNATITETVDFAIYLHKRYKASSWFSYMVPFPGSPLYSVAEKHGRYLSEKRTHKNTELCYLPFNVTAEYILKERARGMKFANPSNNKGFITKVKSFFRS